MYLLQPPLFSFEQILELQPKNRLQAVFSTLNLEPVLQLLKPESKFGPKGYPREAMLRSLIAKQLEAIPNIAKLVERLRTDPSFRYHCGFNAFGTVPSEATFSRFIAKLEKTGAIELLFEQTVAQGRADGIIGNEYVALDSTEIKAWEKPQPKRKPTSDQEAAWGSKRDTSGNQKAWFGYKTHIACDCKSELPIAIVVTPANVHDSKVALPLMKKVTSSLPRDKWPRYWVMDMAYDTKTIYAEAFDRYGSQAIIPLNRRGAKEPPEGFDYDGTPLCSMGYRMAYWGYDTSTNTHKFRCPHVLCKVNCPFGSAWCSDSSYGMVVKTKVTDDLRRFCVPYRGSRNWQLIYDLRTAVERCFSRLKVNLGLNAVRVRGIKRVRFYQVLSCVTLIAATLAVNSVMTQGQDKVVA